MQKQTWVKEYECDHIVEEDEISFRPKNSVIYDTGIKSGRSVQTSPEHGCWTWAG